MFMVFGGWLSFNSAFISERRLAYDSFVGVNFQLEFLYLVFFWIYSFQFNLVVSFGLSTNIKKIRGPPKIVY